MSAVWKGLIVAGVILAGLAGQGNGAPRPATKEIATVLAECRAAYYRLVDYRGTLRHEVWEAGPFPRYGVIEVVFRKPSFLALGWRSGLYAGTQLLAQPSRGHGKVLIRLGGWFNYITVSMSPIDVGEPFVPGLKDINDWLTALVSLAQRPPSDPSLRLVQIRREDPEQEEGRVLLSVPAFLIPFRDNTVATYEFAIERGTGLPMELTLRGPGGEIQQRLTYTELQINVGVTVQAFTWEHDGGDLQTLPGEHTEVDLRGFIQHWQRRYGTLTDYTGIWVVDKRRGQKLVRRETAFKFRKPFEVYFEWIAEGGTVHEALFRKGWNDGRVRIRSSFFGFPVIGDLAPEGYLARRNGPYSVLGFGLNQLVERLQEPLLRGWLQGELNIRFQGVQPFEGRPCYVLEFSFANSQWREYPYYRVGLYWDIERRVPVKQEAFDWNNQLEERQEFRDLRFNVGLADMDFDAANPRYGFLLFRRIPWLDWFLTGRE